MVRLRALVAVQDLRALALATPECCDRCQGTAPPSCGPCYAAQRISDCGCGVTTDLCCPCAPEFQFTITGHLNRTSDTQNGVTYTDLIYGGTYPCGPGSRFGTSSLNYAIRWVRRCVNGLPVDDFTGSEWHYRSSVNNIPEPPLDLAGVQAFYQFVQAFIARTPNANSFPCLIQSPQVFTDISAFRDHMRPCCAGPGHFHESWGPGNPYNPTWGSCGVSDSGSYEDNSHDSSLTQCAGGSHTSGGNSSAAYNFDHDESRIGFFAHYSGQATQSFEWDAAAQWQYDNEVTCQGNPCQPIPTGACCRDFYFGSPCFQTTAEDCGLAAGVYHGDGTLCRAPASPDGVECPATGACCANGACVQATQLQCALIVHGTYRGDGSRCQNADCASATGACCYPDRTCAIRTASVCGAQGGVYLGDARPCTADACNPRGSCCCHPGSPGRRCWEGVTFSECQNLCPGAGWSGGTSCAGVHCGSAEVIPILPVDPAPGVLGFI